MGLAAALFVFLLLVLMAAGWRVSLRTLVMSVVAISLTWTIVTFVPSPSGATKLSPRALSVGSALVASLSSDFPNGGKSSPFLSGLPKSGASSGGPSSIRTRLILWKGSVELAVDRPWFQGQDRPLPILLPLFGYGPVAFILAAEDPFPDLLNNCAFLRLP